MAPTTITPFDPQHDMAKLRNEARNALSGSVNDPQLITWLAGELHTTRQHLAAEKDLVTAAVNRIAEADSEILRLRETNTEIGKRAMQLETQVKRTSPTAA